MIQAFKELHFIYKVLDAAADVLQEDVGRSLCISCGHCCKVNTPHWTTIEGINAVSMLTGMGKLTSVISLAEGWLLEHHKEAKIYEGRPVGWASPQLRDEFNALSITQCPFLDEANHCTIYSVRPLTCRTWGVTRDREGCNRPPGKGETLTQHRYINDPLIRQTIEEWLKGCKERNPTWVTSGMVPSILYRAAVSHEKWQQMVSDNMIASAKLVGVDYDTCLMWQPQVDAVRAGELPELASIRR